MNRREFIRWCLTAGFAVGHAGISIGCSGLKRGDLSDDPLLESTTVQLAPRTRSILHYAALAPSGHNSQPWRVKIECDNEWIIEADPSRRLPCVDPQNRELLLSLGAFIENLCLSAGISGMHADVRVIANTAHDPNVARVTLQPATPIDYPLKRLESRRTVRHGQLSRALTAEDVRRLAHAAAGNLAYFPVGSSHAACIQEAAVESYRIQAGRNDAQRELVAWLRLNDRDARRYRDGLSTEGMEITGLKGWLVRHLIRPEDFLKERYRRQGIDVIADLAGQGGGWMVITSDEDSVTDLIDTGRRFQRMALLARERNIGIHPMTQVLEEQSGITRIANQHGTAFIPQFVLRVGYLQRYPAPVSLRRPVEWFVYS